MKLGFLGSKVTCHH